MRSLLETAISAALEAGARILEVYESGDFSVESKSDNSPLTRADKQAHEAIARILAPTGLPLLSEEGRSIPYHERAAWPIFWLVDPLDGTKEFIKRNGEFTVNIALVRDGQPVAGVIYTPVLKELFFGQVGQGAYKVFEAEPSERASLDRWEERGKRLPLFHSCDVLTVVASRSHLSPETAEFIARLEREHGQVKSESKGSSLKLCMVAEGLADVYPRFAPTMEWDTAAGHAIAVAAGASVLQADGSPMRYNKPDLLNPWFIVRRQA